jgi:endonuclease YncB( thermonuclease family)
MVRRTIAGVIVLLAGLSVWDHLVHPGNDWSRFDGRAFKVVGAADSGTILIDMGGATPEPVRLAGTIAVQPPAPGDPQEATDWSAAAKKRLDELARGKMMTLRLDPTQTRDAAGRLMAWVYPGSGVKVDIASLGEDLAAAGLAFADKSSDNMYEIRIEHQESEARRQSLGLWSQSALGGRPRQSRAAASKPVN